MAGVLKRTSSIPLEGRTSSGIPYESSHAQSIHYSGLSVRGWGSTQAVHVYKHNIGEQPTSRDKKFKYRADAKIAKSTGWDWWMAQLI